MADDLVVTYRVRAEPDALEGRADALLLEQTVELPRSALHDPGVRASTVGRVVAIDPVAEGEYRVAIEQPAETAADEPAQFLNVLFGNSSLQPDVILEDVDVPLRVRLVFGGPRFGVAGLRHAAGVHGRALTCTALKPMGLSVEALASLAGTFAAAGIDIIKDDHGLGDQAFAPFEPRVSACQAAVAEAAARTGHRALYVPNLMGTPDRVRRQADVARQAGVGAVMVSPMLIGIPAFHALVRDTLGVPVVAHPAFGGTQRIAPAALLGRLFTLFGADGVIFPSYGGRFSYDRATCGVLARVLRHPADPFHPALPVAAGGVALDRIPELLAFYGPDTALLVGASVLSDPAQVGARCRAFVAAVHEQEDTS